LFRGQKVLKGPSFNAAERKIGVTIGEAPCPDDLRKLEAQFEETTGFRLEVTCR
jgi:hypothetical protein